MNEIVNSATNQVVRYLLVGSAAALILVSLAWVILKAARVQTPVYRHIIWLYCLIGTVVLPLLWLAGPKMTLAILPTRAEARVPVFSPPSHDYVGTMAMESSPTVPAETERQSTAGVMPRPIRWRTAVAAFWLAGLAFMLTRLTVGWCRLRHICLSATPASRRQVRPAMDGHSLTIRLTRQLHGPVCFGLFRPVILLPEEMYESGTPESLRMVLTHELAHLERRDAWVNIVQRLIEAAYFFHPFIWWASRQLTQQREQICDNYVLAEGVSPSDYTTLLSHLGERAVRARYLQTVALFEGQLLARIRSLLDPRGSRQTKLPRRVAALCTIAVLTGFLVFGSVRLAAQPSNRTGAAAEQKAAPSANVTAPSGEKPEPPRYASRTFNPKTPLYVFVQETSESEQKYIGETSSITPLQIPPCWLWSVHVLGLVQDRDALIREIRESRVPGLEWDGVTDSDVRRLVGLTELRHLGLTGNRITDAGLEQLRGLTRLESLTLSSPHVTDAGLGHLRGLIGLRSLSLSGPKLTEVGVEQLIKALPGLRTLALPYYPMTDAKLALLPSLGKLRKLDLSLQETADAGLARLKDFTALRELRLDLSFGDVTDAGLAHLEGSTALRSLNLWKTKITDAGLAHLKNATSLRDLDLRTTKITDAGLAHLKGLTKLQQLRLIACDQVTGACLQYLSNMIELQRLDMSCPITDAVLQDLKGLTGLLQLDVRGPGITDAGLQHLRGLTRLQWLFLRDAKITDAGLEHLKGLPDLQWLWLIGSGRITDASLEHLKGLTKLWNLSLSLDDAQITDGGLEHLKGLTGLQRLWLTNSQITDAGLVHIKAMPQLAGLALAHSRITDAGLEQIGGLKGLRLLNLNDTQITDAGLEHLQGLTELTDLRLKNTKITDAGLEHLKDLTGLTSLYLNGTPITDAGLEHLKGLTNLGRLELSDTQVTDAGVQQLKRSLPGVIIYIYR